VSIAAVWSPPAVRRIGTLGGIVVCLILTVPLDNLASSLVGALPARPENDAEAPLAGAPLERWAAGVSVPGRASVSLGAADGHDVAHAGLEDDEGDGAGGVVQHVVDVMPEEGPLRHG
jgi:hypothetical protein